MGRHYSFFEILSTNLTYRPAGAFGKTFLIFSTNISPRWGFWQNISDYLYQHIAPLGLLAKHF
jgi:hypothetical protein